MTPNADTVGHTHYWPTRNSLCACGASYYAQNADSRTLWQPDPATIEWVRQELLWELERQDSAGPAAFADSVPAWLARLKQDKQRIKQSRNPLAHNGSSGMP